MNDDRLCKLHGHTHLHAPGAALRKAPPDWGSITPRPARERARSNALSRQIEVTTARPQLDSIDNRAGCNVTYQLYILQFMNISSTTQVPVAVVYRSRFTRGSSAEPARASGKHILKKITASFMQTTWPRRRGARAHGGREGEGQTEAPSSRHSHLYSFSLGHARSCTI